MGLSPSANAPASAGASSFPASPAAAPAPARVTVVCPGEIPKHVSQGMAATTPLYARVTYTPH